MSEPGPPSGCTKPAAEAFTQNPGGGRAGLGQGEAGLTLQQVFSLEVIFIPYILLRFPNLVSSSWVKMGLFLGHQWL